MGRLKELSLEAKSRFGEDIDADEFYFDKSPLIEKLKEKNNAPHLWDSSELNPELIKGFSHPKELLKKGRSEGFKFDIVNGCEELMLDGQIIYFDGLWAEVRRPTEADIVPVD